MDISKWKPVSKDEAWRLLVCSLALSAGWWTHQSWLVAPVLVYSLLSAAATAGFAQGD